LEVSTLLSLKGITVRYGKAVAIENVSLDVAEGSVVSVVGANGAGKSTILRAISGLRPLSSGEVRFMGNRVDGLKTTDIVKLGIVLIPEGRQLFPYLSVLNNLRLGASLCKDKNDIDDRLKGVFKLFSRLQERQNQKAGTLSGGEQQMVAIGRGLMAKPKLLCMDEPSLGLAPVVIERLAEVIADINKRGVSVLLVEQNAHLAFGVAKKGYALQTGRVVFEGDIETMKSSDIVRKIYLGG
jgi:branched-chain amino acid transport system ATP-binding protein